MDSNNILILLLGILYILFGIFKIVICIINIILSNNTFSYFNNIPLINKLITDDYTGATKIFYIIILIFAIYTFLLGIGNINLIHEDINYILSHNILFYYIYGIIGISLIILYTFIIYYPNISKKYITSDDKFIDIYKTIYLGSGILFIISLLIILLYNNYDNYYIYYISVILLYIILVLYIILMIGTDNIYENIKKEILLLIMIPLGTM